MKFYQKLYREKTSAAEAATACKWPNEQFFFASVLLLLLQISFDWNNILD